MKICFITHTLGSFGGTQRIVTTLANKFSEDHNVTIHCWSTKNPEPVYDLNKNVRLVINGMSFIEKVFRELTQKLATAGFFKSKYTLWLYEYMMFFPTLKSYYSRFINRNNFDIVIGGGAFEGLLLSSLESNVTAKRLGRLQSSYDSFFGKRKQTAWKQEAIFSKYLKRLEKVLCLSKGSKKVFTNLIGNNVDYIYNANSFDNPIISSLKNKKFLALGRCAYGKGFDVLMDAFILFSKRNKDWELEILGEGPLKPNLEEKIKKHQLQDRVTLLPGTPDVKEIYHKASVFLFTSRFEGFGIVQVEALSCGLPIIASDIPISKELLEGKNVGAFYVNEDPESLAEVMLRFAEMDLTVMSKNAVEYAEEFTVERIASKWDNLFKEITNS